MTTSNRRPPNAGKGRPAGVPNRVTGDLRAVLGAFVAHNLADAQAMFDRVAEDEPARALELLVRVCEFVLPKLQRTEVHDDRPSPLGLLMAPGCSPDEAARIYQRLMQAPVPPGFAVERSEQGPTP